jgi:hypothetical protein
MLLDVAAHARYLVALPLLIIAEDFCLPMLAVIAQHFGQCELIPASNRGRYEALLESIRRLLASPRTDLAILVLAYIATLSEPSALYPSTASTWVMPMHGGSHQLSLAGWWRTLVSQPLYLMFLMSWLLRVALWARFLRGVSQLKLNLIPAHPDLAGGLGFLGTSIRAYLLLAFTISVTIAGTLAQEILRDGRGLYEFQYVIAGTVIAQLMLFTGPLCLLAPTLLRGRTRGIFQYGFLAEGLGRQFERRWIESASAPDPEALAVQDFSATTDLYSITANVYEMRLIPLRLIQVIPLLVVALLPFVPVVLVALPLDEIVKYGAKLVM